MRCLVWGWRIRGGGEVTQEALKVFVVTEKLGGGDEYAGERWESTAE
jgi:hypothetical protein